MPEPTPDREGPPRLGVGSLDLGHDVYLILAWRVACAGHGVDPECHVVSQHDSHEVMYRGDMPPPADAVGPVGAIVVHRRPDDGTWCEGYVRFDVPGQSREPNGPRWQVESTEPLTLAPSLLCRACDHHGFVREGRWVPA